MSEKVCACCQSLTPVNNFQKKAQAKDGLDSYCKPCKQDKRRTQYIKFKNKSAQYYIDNKDSIINRKKSHYELNKDRIISEVRQYEIENYDSIRIKKQSYYEENKEHKKQMMRDYSKHNLPKFRAYNAKRKAAKLQRTPAWADLTAIEEFYVNCPEGYEVDHIIPLQGKIVSGFHILENLQYLTKTENIKKGNRYVR